MLVRDGMNPIVVTVGPEHTLREARRMTARGVGAGVVIGDELPSGGDPVNARHSALLDLERGTLRG
jgi:electron transfer flavoprotein alpha/beta subunit